MKIFKHHKKIYFGYFICSGTIGLLLLFFGGASHTFPKLTFSQILQPAVLKKYIFTLIPGLS